MIAPVAPSQAQDLTKTTPDPASVAGSSNSLLILHKRPEANTYARSLRQQAVVGGDRSIMHWIDPDLDADVLAGGNLVDLRGMMQNAIDALETGAESLTGGELYVPRGIYTISGPLNVNARHAAGLPSLTISGAGQANTIIRALPDFRSDSAILNLEDSTYCTVKDLFLQGQGFAAYGLQTPNGGSHLTLRRVHAETCAVGISVEGSFMLTMEQCRAKLNGRGFVFPGFHTSMTVNTCYALDNHIYGFDLRGVVYSTFANCGADNNGFNGYHVTAARGLTFQSCGAEGSGRSSWAFEASAAADAATLLPGIRVILDDCFSKDGDRTQGAYGSCIYSSQADTSSVDIEIRGFTEYNDVAPGRSIMMAGSTSNHVIRDDTRSRYAVTVPAGAAAAGYRAPVGAGSTVARPALTARDRGYLFFDTTLGEAGKPIWWTGARWVDADGALT